MSDKRVLVLGAGMVVKPMIRYFAEKTSYQVIVASRTKKHIDELIKDKPRTRGVVWEAHDIEGLKELIQNADIVLSFLPYVYHIKVAELCIEYGKPLVTTSYVKEEMAALDKKAREKGIILLNEIGLDPGIDHMTFALIADRIHKEGGKIKEFYSYCGALPAPEYADNPLKYKFSWSPEGVVRAGNNNARYLKDGKIIDVPSDELFEHRWTEEVEDVGVLEVYPNRDSLVYIKKYGISEVSTIIRGTFRYPGWCEAQSYFKKIKLTDENYKIPKGITTWRKLLYHLLLESNIELPPKMYETFLWLGLFEDKPLYNPESTTFENFVKLLREKLVFKPGEKDLIILKHRIKFEDRAGNKRTYEVSLVSEGIVGRETAVAKTVSLPAAIAADLILKGEITLTGVWIPTHPQIYNKVLPLLEEEDIKPKYRLRNREMEDIAV